MELNLVETLPSLGEVEERGRDANDGRRKSMTWFRVEDEAVDGDEKGKKRMVEPEILFHVCDLDTKITDVDNGMIE